MARTRERTKLSFLCHCLYITEIRKGGVDTEGGRQNAAAIPHLACFDIR